MYELNIVTKEENLAPVREVLASRGLQILAEGTPQKIHLFYPIKKERYGFLGVVNFSGPAEAVQGLAADLNLKEGVLRFMIAKVKETEAAEKSPVKRAGREPLRRTAPKPAETALTNEELEKKIEEILR